MFFSKYRDGIFQESPNLVPIILSWTGRRVNTSSFPQSHFLKVFFFQWKVLFQKIPSTTAVTPHILDSNGVVCFLHFSGYLEADCKKMVSPVLAPLWQVLWQTIQGTEIALIARRSAKWKYIFHCAIKWSGDCPYAERLCSNLARELPEAAWEDWGMLGKSLGKTEESSVLSKSPLGCHWKANPSFRYTNHPTKADSGSV